MSKLKTYKDCFDLPLSKFIDAIVDQNYNALVISGTATDQELTDLWESIYAQYCELSNNSQYSDYQSKLKDYGLMKQRLIVLAGAVQVLSVAYNKEVADALITVGFRHTLDPLKPDNYLKELERLSKQCGAFSGRVKMAENQLNDLTKHIEKKKTTRKDFIDSVAVVSRFVGFRIDPSIITVAEFASYQNQLIDQAKKTTHTKDIK